MQPANFVLLHVRDVDASSRFYEALLDRPPVEKSPTFAMFVYAGGFKIGLWKAANVAPATSGQTGSSEIVLMCDTDREVDDICDAWQAKDVSILQRPEGMDFGRTFTAEDPDGHRIRVYCRADEPV